MEILDFPRLRSAATVVGTMPPQQTACQRYAYNTNKKKAVPDNSTRHRSIIYYFDYRFMIFIDLVVPSL